MTNETHDGAKAIGEEIREARIRLDMTKAEAARRAGVSRRTWHEVEEGTRTASSAETLALFDQVLGFEEGHLWSMTEQSAGRRVEVLRQQAIGLVRLMSSNELEAFVKSEGRDTVTTMIAHVERELVELRTQLGVASGPPEGERGSSTVEPGGGDAGRRRTRSR